MVNKKLETMQNKLAKSLERSGEFDKIEIGYKLGDSFVDKKHGNYLYANKNRNYIDSSSAETPEYLIIFHIDTMTNDDLLKRIKLISSWEYGVGNILWKGKPFFKWARAPFRPGIKHYGVKNEQAMIDLNLNERTLQTITKNDLIYFKPSTEELQIIKFKGNIIADYSHKGEGFFEQERNLVRTRKNDVYKNFDINNENLTLISYFNKDLRLALPVRSPSFISKNLWRLNLAIKQKDKEETISLLERLSINFEDTDEKDLNLIEFKSLIKQAKSYKLV